MVMQLKSKWILAFIAFFVFPFQSMDAQTVKVNAEIDRDQAFENEPLKGTLTITHSRNEEIDPNSVALDQQPLKVEHLRDVKISPTDPLTLSFYRFELPAHSPGLYLLPEISVKVGTKIYRSLKASYEVKTNPFSKPPTTSTAQDQTDKEQKFAPVLRLEALIEGDSTLYPGQLSKFVYRYSYLGDIQLVTEKLPLLDAIGLRKIGEKESKDFIKEGLQVSEISQVIEAIEPGTFSYGPSLVEGYAYRQDNLGRKARASDKLISEAPPVVLTVLPFPSKDMPPSFNGAVGQLKFQASLLTPAPLIVGSEFDLQLKISGTGYFKSVPLPDLFCQPGFSGFFQQNAIPPAETSDEKAKTAIIKLRPLTKDLKEIPKIQFSYFDPLKSEYVILESPEFPITVSSEEEPLVVTTVKEKQQAEKKIKETSYSPASIEIIWNDQLSARDLHNKLFGTWGIFALIPIGGLIYLLQMHAYLLLIKQKQQMRLLHSQILLKKAWEAKEGSPLFFNYIEQGLKQALFEYGLLSNAFIENTNMATTGVVGQVKSFLNYIEEERFSGKKTRAFSSFKKEAQQLYHTIIQKTSHET